MEAEMIIDIESDNIDIDLENENEQEEIDIENEVVKIPLEKNYNKLNNKPQINNVVLENNKTLDELGIQPEGEYPEQRVTNLEIDNLF